MVYFMTEKDFVIDVVGINKKGVPRSSRKYEDDTPFSKSTLVYSGRPLVTVGIIGRSNEDEDLVVTAARNYIHKNYDDLVPSDKIMDPEMRESIMSISKDHLIDAINHYIHSSSWMDVCRYLCTKNYFYKSLSGKDSVEPVVAFVLDTKTYDVFGDAIIENLMRYLGLDFEDHPGFIVKWDDEEFVEDYYAQYHNGNTAKIRKMRAFMVSNLCADPRYKKRAKRFLEKSKKFKTDTIDNLAYNIGSAGHLLSPGIKAKNYDLRRYN